VKSEAEIPDQGRSVIHNLLAGARMEAVADGWRPRVAPCPVLSVPETDLDRYADEMTVQKGAICHS
jgi:hypothetical protein